MLTPVDLLCHEYGVSIKRGADGLEDGEAVLAAGIDDGTDSGEEVAVSPELSCRLIMLKKLGYEAMFLP